MKFNRGEKSIVLLCVIFFFFFPSTSRYWTPYLKYWREDRSSRIFFPADIEASNCAPTRKTGADNNETGFEIKRASEFSDHLSILRFSFSLSPFFFFLSLISKKWSTTFSLTRSGEIDGDRREEIPRKWSRCEIDRTSEKGNRRSFSTWKMYISDKCWITDITNKFRDWNSARIFVMKRVYLYN